jgi:hypothetical protein
MTPETEARWRAEMDMTSRRERALWGEIDRLRRELGEYQWYGNEADKWLTWYPNWRPGDLDG